MRSPGTPRTRIGPALATAMLAICPAVLAAERVTLYGAGNALGQAASEDGLDESAGGSLDLFLGWRVGGGRIDGYLEGNTSLDGDGIGARLPQANADAGTAVDGDGSGRLQISELKYTHLWEGERSLTAGLLDPTVYLDATRINNDENLQFIGAPFVNNPTIEFPDYSLGAAAVMGSARGTWRVTTLLSSTYGIADASDLSYGELTRVREPGRGLFAGAEVAWPGEVLLARMGAWTDTSRHASLDDGGGGDHWNAGAYAILSGAWGPAITSVRLGAADRDVSPAAGFASLSLQWKGRSRVVGLGASRTWASSGAGPRRLRDSTHLEGYLRFQLAPGLQITPSVQYLTNAALANVAPPRFETVLVASLRLHWVFARHP